MPQFEFYTFSSQTFFFLLTFFILYFFITFVYIPRTAEILKMRKKLIKRYSTPLTELNLIGVFYDIYFKKK